VPEGDTLFRTAAVLRRILLATTVTGASGRPGGPGLERLVGGTIVAVEARGKHLLIGFGAGAATPALTLHTHLGLHGSWHRYRVGEPWRRSRLRAAAVIETAAAVAVCFDAPTVELLETRALAIHPTLRALGPDLLAAQPDVGTAMERLAYPSRADLSVGDALLDQTALAGLGNVYRSEVCFIERVDPWLPVAEVPAETLARLVGTGARLLAANRERPARMTTPDALGGGPDSSLARPPSGRLWVYGRAGRPCRRCGTLIRSAAAGPLARRVYWCPDCQPAANERSRVPEGGPTRSQRG
jgi:endonuclease VIII